MRDKGVEQSPSRVRRVGDKAAGTPSEFRRVRGRGEPKSEVGAPSAQCVRRETRLGKHRSRVARYSNIKSKVYEYTGVVLIY